MKNFKLLLLILLPVVAMSCGSAVKTVNPSNTDLSKYQTFAYLPNSNVEVEGKNYNNDKVNAMVVEAINENMREAGYTLERNNPDLLVLISTKTDMETRVDRDPIYATYPYGYGVNAIRPYYNQYYYYGYPAYTNILGYDTDTYSYKEGTTVINLVDRKTKQTVWKGITSQNIYEQETAMVASMVNRIFEEYPLKQN